ncbi:cytochrome-c peroxidase [Pseudenhygromyxa sp. WMMC2535]|uniref:cytochrome-c peroxidase n=1 Tax=Pseudenhygromyxa sp. WMMC2535 TaxID=2712867 RepID=UPI0015580C5E|nr:cytochrome c peroxidase [Pseudenhygromyxa sp. WMMC2535]NVB42841.1 cytochrome-c peroxidase [Pseudenhygromyxa sp. WMMC2535]
MLSKPDIEHLAFFFTPASIATAVLVLPLLLSGCDIDEDAAGDDEAEATDGSSNDESSVDESSADSSGEEALAELPSPTLPDALLNYSPELPDHFQTTFVINSDNTPGDNLITDAGATLGRVLFWDKRLSQNGSVACGSCHDPALGFSDDVALSTGFDGDLTGRNSMPLINQRWYGRGAMFWDERADTLEDQVLMPIQDSAEMGLTLDELLVRVEDADYYAPLFEAAFGDAEVSEERISQALSQFVRSIVSYQSRWDEGVIALAGEVDQDFPNFTAEENLGKDIFFGRGRCGTCHMFANPLTPPPAGVVPPPPTDNLAIAFVNIPANNGLPDDGDEGYGAVTGVATDIGTFKSPSLRNVAQTGPYMHDGRFDTLDEVVLHYSEGIELTQNLDARLRDPNNPQLPLRLNLDANERAALVAFLGTFTDETLAGEARWADPF